MSYSRVAVVTGANKGIGLAIVRNLALKYSSSISNNGPLLIYLAARDQTRGELAVKELQSDDQLVEAKALTKDGGLVDIKYGSLDVSETESIQNFAAFLKKEHPDGIDIHVNNAGYGIFDSDETRDTLLINYHGTLETTRNILPVIKDGGRLVNISSLLSALSFYSPEIREAFLAAKTVADITALMNTFEDAVKSGTAKEKGWPSSIPNGPNHAYIVSKAGTTAMTKVIAEEEKRKGSKTLINCCCPGYVNTDMSRGGGVLTPDQGATLPVQLALDDIGEQTGLFWQEGKPSKW